MKKLLSVLLSVSMAVTFAVGMTACDEPPAEHTHEYATAWSSDETDHWHACTVKNCTEVKDRAAHTWNGGEITTPATETADGIKTFTCTVCGKTKTESVEYVPTVSYKVTDTEWQAIFTNINNPESTGGNMTVDVFAKQTGDTDFAQMSHLKYDWQHKAVEGKSQDQSVYYALENGKVYEYTQSDSDIWIKEEWYTPTDANAFFVSMYDGVWLQAFVNKYAEFTYDEVTKMYTGPYFSWANGGELIEQKEGMTVSLHFEDEKLITMEVIIESRGVQKLQFSDYGTTTVTLPAIA